MPEQSSASGVKLTREQEYAALGIPMCRFRDKSPAKARYKTPQGCVCFPEDREQDLCEQHIIKWGIIDCDGVELLKEYY